MRKRIEIGIDLPFSEEMNGLYESAGENVKADFVFQTCILYVLVLDHFVTSTLAPGISFFITLNKHECY